MHSTAILFPISLSLLLLIKDSKVAPQTFINDWKKAGKALNKTRLVNSLMSYKRKRQLLTTILFSLIMILCTLAQIDASTKLTDIIELKDYFRSINITNRTGFLEENQGSFINEGKVSKNYSEAFQQIKDNEISFGYKKSVYWFKSVLKNKTGKKSNWIVEYQTVKAGKEIALFILSNEGTFSEIKRNSQMARGVHRIDYKNPLVSLTLQPDQKVTVVCRIKNTTVFPLSIYVWPQEMFFDNNKEEYTFFGIIFGVILVLVLYNLFLLFATKDFSYLSYVILILTVYLYHLNGHGLLYEFFPILDSHNSLIFWISPLLMAIALIQFARYYLKISKFSPLFDKGLFILISPLFLSGFAFLVSNSFLFIQLRNILCLLAGLSVLSIAILVYAIKNYLPGLFFSLSMVPILILTILQGTRNVIGWDLGLINDYGSDIGIVITIFLFSYGLAYRVNITKKEKEEAQKETIKILQKSEKLKDEFLANTSHELRTPLAGIIGLSETLLEKLKSVTGSEEKRDLEMIIESGNRLSRLINDILDFSKLKHDEMQIEIKPAKLKTVVNLVIHQCKPLTDRKNIILVDSIPADLPFVAVDVNRLQQILFNLIGNAIKFTNAGQIEISADRENEYLIVKISDTGIGIPKDQLGKIFNLFERGEIPAQMSTSGTGLGLALAKKLVELHQGKISVASTQGKGSCFSFSLPIYSGPLDEVEETAQAISFQDDADLTTLSYLDSLKENRDNETSMAAESSILIVDDDPVILKVLTYYLASQNYRILTAMDGNEALETINARPEIDLVLLDVMMPGITGYEVCEKIRKSYSPGELPVLLLTALSQVSDIVMGLESGANDYLQKPISREELITRVKTQIGLRKSIHRLKELRKMEVQATQNDKKLTIGVLGAEIAHEIVYPLNFFRFLLDELRSTGKIELQDITIGQDEVERLERMLTSLRSMKHPALELSDVVVLQIVNRATELLRDQIDSNAVSITSSIPETLTVNASADQILQLFANLLKNALQAAEEQGKVEIRYVQKENQVYIEFWDSGPGIPEDFKKDIFSPWITTKSSGTGLGLTVCQRIVRSFGWSISTRREQEKTCFSVEIPASNIVQY